MCPAVYAFTFNLTLGRIRLRLLHGALVVSCVYLRFGRPAMRSCCACDVDMYCCVKCGTYLANNKQRSGHRPGSVLCARRTGGYKREHGSRGVIDGGAVASIHRPKKGIGGRCSTGRNLDALRLTARSRHGDRARHCTAKWRVLVLVRPVLMYSVLCKTNLAREMEVLVLPSGAVKEIN